MRELNPLGIPTAPPLPQGEVLSVRDRGEFFVRMLGASTDAVPVLLIHGWQATADLNFFPLFAPLSERHLVIAPDLRGHGRSLYPEAPFTMDAAADDQAALLRHLHIPRAIIVGYSLGTAVAQTMAERHPALVSGLVLAGGEFAPDRRLHEKLYLRAGDWQASVQRLTQGRWGAHRIVSKASRETPAIEAIRPWLVGEIERGHPASLRAAGRALGRFDGRPIAAAHRQVPTAVVITRRDHLVRPARQERLATAWRATRVELDADHDAPLARPDDFVRAMLEAVASVAARTPAVAELAG